MVFFANGSGSHAIAVSGANSSLFVNAQILQGNIYNEGGLTLTAIALVESAVHITSTGRWAPDIRTVIGLYTPIFDVGSIVKGNIGDISNGNTIYGAQNFLDKVVTHLIPSDEVVGRPLVAEDVGKFISYNAVTDGLYTLPVTADADISPGTTIPFYQYGSGKISFTAGAGATVQSLVGTAMRTNGAFAKAEVNKQSDTLWVVTGNIEIAP